jgi:hypothetical protein
MHTDFAISNKTLNQRDVTQRSPLTVCLASVLRGMAISFKTVPLSANCGDLLIADCEDTVATTRTFVAPPGIPKHHERRAASN